MRLFVRVPLVSRLMLLAIWLVAAAVYEPADAQAAPPMVATGVAYPEPNGSVTFTGTVTSRPDPGSAGVTVNYSFEWSTDSQWQRDPGHYAAQSTGSSFFSSGSRAKPVREWVLGDEAQWQPGTRYHYAITAYSSDSLRDVTGNGRVSPGPPAESTNGQPVSRETQGSIDAWEPWLVAVAAITGVSVLAALLGALFPNLVVGKTAAGIAFVFGLAAAVGTFGVTVRDPHLSAARRALVESEQTSVAVAGIVTAGFTIFAAVADGLSAWLLGAVAFVCGIVTVMLTTHYTHGLSQHYAVSLTMVGILAIVCGLGSLPSGFLKAHANWVTVLMSSFAALFALTAIGLALQNTLLWG